MPERESLEPVQAGNIAERGVRAEGVDERSAAPGPSFADELDLLVIRLEHVTAEAQRRADVRALEGRPLSGAMRIRLAAVHARLGELLAVPEAEVSLEETRERLDALLTRLTG